ncbi:MAG: 2-iminoacetate synthase ThiH [Gammaproteobacteria bacterium]|nr:2-iminoacetate synthase ThiH [Gammaproteobacteria bacterium]MBU1555589.1 2-iminoacetate synthase ThiH [Gammaproteobacteria bacterium]MBU2069564.1 2-iminoacetate synthase ThiH [Gammaproteobacteria bacterium]MBU2183026.1 2-iminoacetate synthase ThiH [Gammaproteobacteria bacterium]MBU2205556.1 2-iminoacetate synthase ThiH [Gammaproteobacteria bacterium]
MIAVADITTSYDGGFIAQWQHQNWQQLQLYSRSFSAIQVQHALQKQQLNLSDLQTLLSPAAAPFLPQLANKAQLLTRQRFGRTVQLFAPLYLSNLCANECTYCGFSLSQKVKRRTLTTAEVEQECRAIKAMGIDQVLLVSGEHERKVGIDYFCQILPVVRRHFSQVQLEVQPLSTDDYRRLKQAGVDAVMLYQETYNQLAYQQYHLKGKKSDIHWRIDAPDRVGRAGIDKIGLGILLGLTDWRTDAIILAQHIRYLQKHYWQSRFSLSVPRIRPCSGGATVANPISDKELIQLICAFRLFAPELEISLSTRESAQFRQHVVPLAISSISAGSKTQPGGYSVEPENLEQFSIDDNRSPQQVAEALLRQGLQPVWKDWEPFLGRA